MFDEDDVGAGRRQKSDTLAAVVPTGKHKVMFVFRASVPLNAT
jgi:hypothetical protein